MSEHVTNAEKLMEVFRENESDLPPEVYKAMIEPLLVVCNKAFDNQVEEEQANFRKRLFRLLEDNPKLATIDKDHLMYMEDRIKMGRTTTVNQGTIRLPELNVDVQEEDEEFGEEERIEPVPPVTPRVEEYWDTIRRNPINWNVNPGFETATQAIPARPTQVIETNAQWIARQNTGAAGAGGDPDQALQEEQAQITQRWARGDRGINPVQAIFDELNNENV